MAVAIGVPLGILAARRPRVGAPIVWLVNAAQTMPSLAMFGFLLPLPFIGGLGARVAITVLIVYALLPIVRTTIAGIRSVDPALVEAGMALGMTPRQLLRQVQLPLALPSIVAGIRVAAVIGVGTATIAAAVGAGGLGEYIFRGLSMVDPTVILAGAIPAAVLALSLDGGLTLAERWVRSRLSWRPARRSWMAGRGRRRGARPWPRGPIVASLRSETPIRVGSKNFTEQILLGELLAQTLEARGIARRAAPESRRHVHLRSRDPLRRHRRLRRVHGHGATPPSSASRQSPTLDACSTMSVAATRTPA